MNITLALQLITTFGIPALISGLVLLKVTRNLSCKEQKDESRASTAREENIIIMTNIQAVGHLSEATAIALRDGKVNGAMKDALDYYHDARDKTNIFLLHQNAVANH
jgi:hypothetical protein